MNDLFSRSIDRASRVLRVTMQRSQNQRLFPTSRTLTEQSLTSGFPQVRRGSPYLHYYQSRIKNQYGFMVPAPQAISLTSAEARYHLKGWKTIHDLLYGPSETVPNQKRWFPSWDTITGSSSPGGGSSLNPGALPEGARTYLPYLEEASRAHGVPVSVLAAIAEIESGWNPQAVSPQGAVGIMQVMPAYHAQRAARYGGDLRDPRVNILVGAEILAENYRRIKAARPDLPEETAWEYAAAAYLGAFDWQRMEPTGATDALGTSGPEYIRRFRQAWDRYRSFEQPSASSAWSVFGGKTYPITQEYWAQANPSWYPSTGGRHPGIDIGVPEGTILRSPFDGVVTYAGWMDGYGYTVWIDFGQGILILAHLAEPLVGTGARVSRGSVIGRSGNTGFSTGPHLHIEVRDYQGNSVDPRHYLSF